MKTTTLIRVLVVAGPSLLLAAPAFAGTVINPPPSACPEDGVYANHGEYVSCVAQHEELQGENGNSDAGQSDIGK